MKKIVGKIGLIGVTVVMMSGCFSEPKPLPQVDYKSCKTNAEFFSKLGLRHDFVVGEGRYSQFYDGGRYEWGNLYDYRWEEIDKELKGFCESRGGRYEREFKKGFDTVASNIQMNDPKHRTFAIVIDRTRCVIDKDKIFSLDKSTNAKRAYLTVRDDEKEREDVMIDQQERKRI